MKILDKFFNPRKIECPRCLGKGDVEWEDIKRLGKELKWMPGTCAYCMGSGKVKPNIQDKIPVDMTYLTTNISDAEKDRLLTHDEGAHDRARHMEMNLDNFIKEVHYLHFVGNMDANKITDFYFLHQSPNEIKEESMDEFFDYIKQIIALDNRDFV